MNSQQYILSHYIKNIKNVEDVNKHLYQTHNIMSKSFPELDMTIYYNKYDNKHKSQMELASRSVILSNSHNVVCYSCPTPIYNTDASLYLSRNKDKECNAYVCYEGSLISLFTHNNKWYMSSRRNIYTGSNITEEEPNSQFKMFFEVLEADGSTFDDFTKKLDIKYTYHFVLIHHLNENIVNYVSQFGPNYKKLCFIYARNKETMDEISSDMIETTFISDNIFLPKHINNEMVEEYMFKNKETNILNKPEYEGIVIKINGMILKLQSSSYQFHKSIGSDKNLFRGFLTLYQNNTLKSFLAIDCNTKFKKIVNPLNTLESFDMVGMIDALFKVITSELHNLYYKLWNDKEEHLNKALYTMLPREYKDILFYLRGIYFTNKNKKTKEEPVLKLKDVYNLIKTVDVSLLVKFIRCRKLMLNWSRLDKTENSLEYAKTLHICEKVYYKLSAIYTIKLFPEIMPNDLPTFN